MDYRNHSAQVYRVIHQANVRQGTADMWSRQCFFGETYTVRKLYMSKPKRREPVDCVDGGGERMRSLL